MMSPWRCIGIALWVVATASAASAQYPIPDVPANPWPVAPSQSTVTRTHPGGEIGPSRRVESRTRVNGVDLATSVIERPDVEGRMRPSVEMTTETVRIRPNVVRTRQDIFVFDQSRRRMLVESTESEQEIRGDGSSNIVRTTLSPDPTGRLMLTAREIEHIRSVAPGVTETETAIFRPGPNRDLLEAERISQTERQLGAGLQRRDTTRSVRDANGRFQTTETRSEDVRTGPADSRGEETIHRLDATGTLAVDQRDVIRRSRADGHERTTVETFSREGAPTGSLQLNRRVTRTTTSGTDGSSRIDEDVEVRVPVAPGDPLHRVERGSSTIRNIDGRYFEMQREVLELDGNRQMTPRIRETGSAAATSTAR